MTLASTYLGIIALTVLMVAHGVITRQLVINVGTQTGTFQVVFAPVPQGRPTGTRRNASPVILASTGALLFVDASTAPPTVMSAQIRKAAQFVNPHTNSLIRTHASAPGTQTDTPNVSFAIVSRCSLTELRA